MRHVSRFLFVPASRGSPPCGRRLYPLGLPVAPPDVAVTQQEDAQSVHHLGRPAQRHVQPQVEHGVGDVGHIDHQRGQLQCQRGARVARARHGLEIYIGGHQHQVGGTHHPQRLHGGTAHVGHVGVDAQHGVRKEAEQRRQRQHEEVGQPDVAVDEAGHLAGTAGTDEVADQRTAGGGKGHHHHEEDAGHAADDVGHRQRPFAQVLHVEEEQEPGGEGDGVLYHGPQRHAEHASQHVGTEAGYAVQPVLADVDAAAGVEDEEEQRDALGQRGADGGTGDAQCGQSAVAEYQQVVEHDVAQHHDDGVQRQRLGLRGAQEEGAEHDGGKGEEGAEDAPVQVVARCLVDVGRGDDAAQDDGGEYVGERKHYHGHAQLEVDALVEQPANLGILLLAVAAGDEYLCPDAESERHHEDDHVEDAGNGRCAQLHLAHTAQKGSVGHSYHLLHDEADEDGVGDAPDVTVGIGCLHIVKCV